MKIKELEEFSWTYVNDTPLFIRGYVKDVGDNVSMLCMQKGQIIDLGPKFIAEASRDYISQMYYEGYVSFIDDDGNEHAHDPSIVIEKPKIKLPRNERELDL